MNMVSRLVAVAVACASAFAAFPARADSLLAHWPFTDGRCVSPVIDLRKPTDENAFYLLTFEAKSSAEGTWLFESLDGTGASVGGDRSALYATEKWRSYQIPVPVVPETTGARLAFEGPVRPSVRNVRIRK